MTVLNDRAAKRLSIWGAAMFLIALNGGAVASDDRDVKLTAVTRMGDYVVVDVVLEKDGSRVGAGAINRQGEAKFFVLPDCQERGWPSTVAAPWPVEARAYAHQRCTEVSRSTNGQRSGSSSANGAATSPR